MKIAYFLNSYPNIHKIVAHDEMRELARLGHTITVVAVWGGGKQAINNLPFNVIYIKNKLNPFCLFLMLFSIRKKHCQHFILLKEYLGIRDSLIYLSSYHQICIQKFDRIHAHFANNAALKGYLLSKYLKIPFSCTGHGSELLLYPEPYLRELIINSKPFITISNYNKELLVKKYNLKPSQITVNYCGIDTEYFTRKGVPYPDNFNIVSVTALKEIKGVKYLIKACHLLKQNNINFYCKIIGDGEDRNLLEELITGYSLEKNITLVGAIKPDKIKLDLLNASIFVLPSLSEGIPVAVMEAMAMELPVIATNITGLPEIIQTDINGILVQPKNSHELADSIIRLYHSENQRYSLGKAARKTIEKKFNLKINTKLFEKLLMQ